MTEAASDPLIWAGHPATERYLPEVFGPYFAQLLASRGTLAVRLGEDGTGPIIGCSRFYPAPDVDDSVSIGFTFLRRDQWGGSTNRAMKGLMLAHAFKSVDAVWLHIGTDNIRSKRATAKLGAVHQYDSALSISGRPGLTSCFRLDRSVWS